MSWVWRRSLGIKVFICSSTGRSEDQKALHDVWTRVGEGKRGRSSKVKEGKSSFKKSVYRESGNLGAAAVWDSVWGKKMD